MPSWTSSSSGWDRSLPGLAWMAWVMGFPMVSEASKATQQKWTLRGGKTELKRMHHSLITVFSFLREKKHTSSLTTLALCSQSSHILLVKWNNCFHGDILAASLSRTSALATFAPLVPNGNSFDKQSFLRVVLKIILTKLWNFTHF